jgi:Ser/Thr protein kinase RdoA (MazF antagonist)
MPVTFWRSLGDGEHYGTTTDLALLFKGLHHLDPPAHIGLPPTERFAWTERRLASAHLADADRALLAERLADLRQGYDQLTFELLPGVIHDDANVGNVLVDRDGVPRLIDLDSVCVGPREWDLVLTALFYERFGWHTRAEYEAFCRVYGFDVMAWSGYATLADVRELVMVTWMAQNAHQDDRTAAELAKRIHSIRTGSSRRDWQPF